MNLVCFTITDLYGGIMRHTRFISLDMLLPIVSATNKEAFKELIEREVRSNESSKS